MIFPRLPKLSVLTVLGFAVLLIASQSHAEIYLRKDDRVQSPSAVTQPKAKTAPLKQQPSATTNPGLPSKNAEDYAKMVAQNCTGGQWESPACLRSVSENVLVMASNYGAALQENNKENLSETVKQNCAAATAGTKGDYPAYAMRSAFVECVNAVYEVSESSKITPDMSQYQLLVASVQCLDKAPSCAGIEQGLQRYK